MKSPAIHSYYAAYEQANRDIDIEEKNAVKVKSEQLEELRRREKKAQKRSGLVRHNEMQSTSRGVMMQAAPYSRNQKTPPFLQIRAPLYHYPNRYHSKGHNQPYNHIHHGAPVTNSTQNTRFNRSNP